MAYTEFCCRSGGSNLNAGTLTGNSTEPGTSASFTYASGNWVASTGVFTVASGDPQNDGVAVGDFASVYADGSTETGFVGRVTARTTTTITVSLTAKSGTAPTDGTGNRTLRIGGAWAGMSGTSGFPMNFVTNTLTNTSGDFPRVNYKSDQTMSVTAAITPIGADTRHQGYTTSYNDLGKAVLRGPTTGLSFILIGTTVGINAILCDFDCAQNGATTNNAGVFWNSGGQVIRSVVHDVRGSGFQTNSTTTFLECEAYACNQSNSASLGGFHATAAASFIRCISHDNTGSNANGFYCSGNGVSLLHCVADTNGARGFQLDNNATAVRMVCCDAYNNTSDGIRITSTQNVNVVIENSNIIKNGGWGIATSGAGKRTATVVNCGFGAGTQANTSGTITGIDALDEIGTVTYASDVTPWVDPANGDFRINLATAKNAGRGAFTQTASSYSGTVGYPDIGAAQSQASAAGGSLINSQQLVRQGWIG